MSERSAVVQAFAVAMRVRENLDGYVWQLGVTNEVNNDLDEASDADHRLVLAQVVAYSEILRQNLERDPDVVPHDVKLLRVDALLELTKVLDRIEHGELTICVDNNGGYDPVGDDLPLLGVLRKLHARLLEDVVGTPATAPAVAPEVIR